MSSVDPVLLTQDLPNLNTQKEGSGTSTFLEIPTGVHDHVDETWATDPSVSPVLQVGHSQDLDLATQIEGRIASTLLEVSTEEKNNVDEIQGLPYHATHEGRGASIPLHGAHDTDGTTTKQTRSTTTISITRESLLSMTPSPTTEDSTSISNPGIDRTQFDDVDTETDVQNISPTDPSTGGSYLSPDASDLWLQNLFLSEVREAVFPAPTPIPFTVKFWQEHDRRMDTKGFFSNFVPLTVDVLESDFVPLMHPAATDTNRNSVSDMFENEKSDDSDIGLSKSINEDLPEETILEEEVTSVDGVPRSQQQHPSTTAAAGSEDGPSNPTEGLAPDSVLSQSSTAGGAASDSGDSVEEDTRSLPTVADIEFHPGNGTINEKEEEKEREKKKRKKKRKKIKKDKEEETIAEDQSDRDKKPNTSRPRLSVTPNDLRDYNRTSPARVQDVRNVSSSGLPINTQFTLSPTPSSSVSPSISGATNYNPSHPWQRTDGEHRTHVPPSQDTSSPTQSSLDKLVSHDEDQSRHQSPKNETGAPVRPTPADDTRSTLREEESGGANGARMPRVHAAVAVAVLMTLL
ncbi:hypothetical protein GWK47_001543 [Chionoecetes opilio]|uniref:Uncharacterized protein n=1 Tax=Chionoecetes opilio TaxID=41210 RepID=A0A8J4XTU4_CHIOP|nr:hypothetical protein GWK47_001543 [Chionoecetes opilio]